MSGRRECGCERNGIKHSHFIQQQRRRSLFKIYVRTGTHIFVVENSLWTASGDILFDDVYRGKASRGMP